MPAPVKKNIHKGLQFLICGMVGTCILLLLSLVQPTEPMHEGEYYVSAFFRNQYSWIAVVIFFIAGFAAAYILQWSPWITGIGLIAVFPTVAIVEAIHYRGSHNLIPFEMLVFAFWALPGIIAAFAGKYLAKRNMQKNQY